MESDLVKSKFDLHLWMYTVLMIEADKFAYAIKGNTAIQHEFKYRFNSVLQANNVFIKYIKTHNVIDILEDQGEWFSKALEVIHSEQDIGKKQELCILLKEWGEGKVAQSMDFMDREDVINLVKQFTVVDKSIIEQSYDNYKSKTQGA